MNGDREACHMLSEFCLKTALKFKVRSYSYVIYFAYLWNTIQGGRNKPEKFKTAMSHIKSRLF